VAASRNFRKTLILKNPLSGQYSPKKISENLTHLFSPSFALVLDNLMQVAVALRALPDKKIWAQILMEIFVVKY
jgi:hypothetical protein